MPTKAQLEASQTYADILTEIQWRVDAVDHCTLGRSGLAPPFITDFAFIQIRMICELVALGCLVAHGDIKEASAAKLQKEWSADRIMVELEDLHTHFFPQRVNRTPATDGHHLQAVQGMSKDELLSLYHECGNALHRGSLRKLLKGRIPHQVNFPEITSRLQRIVDLLGSHVVVIKGGDRMLLGSMAKGQPVPMVQVAIAETPEGGKIDYEAPTFLKDPPD